MNLNVTIRTAQAELVRTAFDAAATPGKFKFYTGTTPATGAAITTETLLGTLVMSYPCAPAASAGAFTFSAITSDNSADASGTIGWARGTDGGDAFVADFTVGIAGSGADIIVNSTTVVAGGTISMSSATYTQGNA